MSSSKRNLARIRLADCPRSGPNLLNHKRGREKPKQFTLGKSRLLNGIVYAVYTYLLWLEA